MCCVQVGGKAGYAWGDKWWERAFDTALLQTMDNSVSSPARQCQIDGAARRLQQRRAAGSLLSAVHPRAAGL